jgi:biopolymer transport protein ExbD
MITRPLELLSKLRPPPRSFDVVYLVNAALIALFFVLFGSRFVVSPAIHLKDGSFSLPTAAPGTGTYVAATIYVTATAGGQYILDTGGVTYEQLQTWLREQAKLDPQAALLIRADEKVPYGVIVGIKQAANDAGIKSVESALETSSARNLRAP